MDDKEQETLPDNFVVEITNLDDSISRPRLPWPRLTPRQRHASLAATSVLFVLIVGLLLSSASGVDGLFARVFFHPSSVPSPSIEAGPLSIYLRGNPTWGHFTLDGKVLNDLAEPGHGRPLTLTHGLHTIVWQAEPFRSKTCIFTVIDAISANGPCFLNGTATIGMNPGINALVLTFLASLADLPTDQRVALTQQLQTQFAAYTSSTQLSAGEFYAISEQEAQANPALCKPFEGLALCYARAEQPLLATLSLQVDNSTSNNDPCVVSGQCNNNNQDCRMFCSDPILDYGQPEIEGWSVIAMIRLLWSYRTLTGQIIASDQPDSALRGSQFYQSVSLHLERSAQNGWQITLFPSYTPPDFSSDNPLCVQATGDTMSVLNASFDNNANMYVSQAAINPAQMASGCLTIAAQPIAQIGATPTPSPTQDAIPPASFLLRFGVLLAVNASARKLCPDLPFADAAEEHLAQNLQASFMTSA